MIRRRLTLLAASIAAALLAGSAGADEAPGLRDWGTPNGFINTGRGQTQMSIDGWNHQRFDYLHGDGERTNAVYDIWFPMLCPPSRPYVNKGGALVVRYKSPLPFVDCQPSYDGRFLVNRDPQGVLAYRPRGWDGTEPAVWSQFVTYVDPGGIYFELLLGNG